MWIIKILWSASATEKGTAILCDPAEIWLSVQHGQGTTTPKETTSVALGLISMERGKPSHTFFNTSVTSGGRPLMPVVFTCVTFTMF